jgi:hypothetical protein
MLSTSTATQPQDNAAQLRPKEHGAYAILAIPIVSALLEGGPTIVGLCVAIASVAGFLAHEPLLIAIGHRGGRAQQSTPMAKTRLTVLLAVTVIGGSLALLLGNASVRWSLVACLVVAAISYAVAIAGIHRTLGGQFWGVVGLSLPCVPILLAVGTSISGALMIWGTWLLGFSSTTIAVRSVIAAQKRQPRWIHTTVLCAITLVIGFATAVEIYLPLVTLPMVLLSWYLLFVPPPAKYLKRVGWTLVAATVATAVLLIQNSPA